MNRNRFLIIVMVLLLPTLAVAELTPNKGKLDSRVRVVDYNPLNVIKLATFYGVSTHVQFADGETIKDVAVGDDQAWKVAPRGNHLFIKPTAIEADTNLTIVTDKRTYQFALVVQPHPIKDAKAWTDPNLIFSLTFRYPDEDAAKLAANEKKAAQQLVDNKVQSKLAASVGKKDSDKNYNYWVAGSTEISPTSAFDDGRFIFLAFSNNRDMPAIFEVDKEGNESLINTNVVGNTIVIQRMIPELILRKGKSVASVVNRSFDLNGGIDNTSGTVAPDVKRVIKEVRQ